MSFTHLKNKNFLHPTHKLSFPFLEQVTQEDGKRHYVDEEGIQYTSMTTALKWMSEKGIADWKRKVGEEEAKKVSDLASHQGNHFHYMCENYLNNRNDLNQDPKYHEHMATFQSAKPLLNRIDNVIAVEQPLHSKKYRLAGTADCIAEFDGVLSVIDFKTTKKPKKEEWVTSYFYQCTGYAKMFQEMFGYEIKQIVVLMANNNEIKPQLWVKNRAEFDAEFDMAINHYYTKVAV